MGMLGKGMVTVVIPPFNEEKAIGLVLDEVLGVGCSVLDFKKEMFWEAYKYPFANVILGV